MTFEQTNTLVKAINEIETWAASITRAWREEEVDFASIKQMEGWLNEAKQTIFELANK